MLTQLAICNLPISYVIFTRLPGNNRRIFALFKHLIENLNNYGKLKTYPKFAFCY